MHKYFASKNLGSRKANIFILFVLFFPPIQLFGQNAKPYVDKRVETLAIVFRLAGSGAYSMDYAESYATAINEYFDKYKSDSLIILTNEMLYNRKMSADGVMTLAVNLELKNGKFKLIPYWKDYISPRWHEFDVPHYVGLLNRFYKTTNTEYFFEQQKSYYKGIIDAFEKSIPALNTQWHFDFYGKKSNMKFNTVIGCGNGTYSYGPTAKSKKGKDIYAIMGSYNFDYKTGKPYFDTGYDLSTFIHEFNHPFVNPTFDKNITPELEEYGALLFEAIPEIGQAGNRDGNTLLIESIVRSAVVRYMLANDFSDERIKIEIADQMGMGYVWIKELVELLDVYERNRSIYPTLDSFYPRIVDFFKQISENIHDIKESYEISRPKVIGIKPFENNSNTVNPNTTELTIEFDKSVFGEFGGYYPGSLGEDAVPVFTSYDFSKDNKELNLTFNLDENKEYEFTLYLSNLRDKDGLTIRDHKIKFKTGYRG